MKNKLSYFTCRLKTKSTNDYDDLRPGMVQNPNEQSRVLFHLGKSEQISLGNAASLKTKGK